MEKECFSVRWEDYDEEEENDAKLAKKRNHGGEIVSNRPSRKCPFFRENNIHRVSLAASLNSDVLTC